MRGFSMAEFGKRNAGGRVQSVARAGVSPGAAATQADLAAAAEVIAAGKLPTWTNVGPERVIMAMFLVAAVYLFFAIPYAPDLLRDRRLAGTWQAAYDMQARDGHCTRFYFLLTRCTAEIASLAEPDAPATSVGFIMGFAGGGGEALVPVRSTADPSVVTIAYAAETELRNRTLTFAALTLMTLAVFVGGLGKLARGRYKDGEKHRELLAGLAALGARMETAPAAQQHAAA
jgi:hypothetical protein